MSRRGRSKLSSLSLLLLLILLPLPAIASSGESRAESPARELVIYTYDSMVAKGGLGPEIFPLFEKKCGCRIRAVAAGDGGQLLNRIQLDAQRGKPVAQVVLGIDQQLWDRARPFVESWPGDWTPKGYKELEPQLTVERGFLPYDYGVLAFMADQQALDKLGLPAPRSIRDLLKPEWKRRFILQDPRTSTPGVAFLLYANQVWGEGYWKNLKSQWLAILPGWDQAYGLFLQGEAPLVWSYTTSQAYHEENGDTAGPKRRYRAVVFEEGNPVQIEGAAIVKGTAADPARLKLSRDFLEFLLSAEAQDRIPRTNWMFPVKSGKLPASFTNLPRPAKIVSFKMKANEITEALSRWKAQVEGAR